MKARYLGALLLWSCAAALWAQLPENDWEFAVESQAEQSEEGSADLVQWAEEWQARRASPLSVNFSSQDEWQALGLLDVFQVHNILSYRAAVGKIYSPYELLQIKGIDSLLWRQLVPLLDFRPEPLVPSLAWSEIRRFSRHELIARSIFDVQPREGFRRSPEAGGFLGRNPQQHYLRYRGRFREHLSLGFTGQQDAGEPWGGAASPAGFDFASAHLALENYGALRQLVIGDYQAEFGQGLALWTGLAMGKGATVLNTQRFPRAFRPYTGADENRFLRGAAATYRWRALEASVFFSHRRQDAQLARDSLGQNYAESWPRTGLHRSESERARKGLNRLQLLGGHLRYRGERGEIGFSAVQHQLRYPYRPRPAPYREPQLWGRQLQNYSLDYRFIWRRLQAFGEGAWSRPGAGAALLGFHLQAAEALSLQMVHRNFASGYRALYHAPFAEAGQAGEVGTYWALQWQWSRRWQFQAFWDHYRFRALRFGVNAPSQGRDVLLQWDYRGGRHWQIYTRLRAQVRERNLPAEARRQIISPLQPVRRWSWRLHGHYQWNKAWSWAQRIELSYFQREAAPEWGQLLLQDLRYRSWNGRWRLSARLAFINTPSFQTRIFAYEHDLTYAFSIPPYYGRALRSYLLGHWEIMPRLTLQVKYGLSLFHDRQEISSGLERIAGQRQSQWRMQLRWRF